LTGGDGICTRNGIQAWHFATLGDDQDHAQALQQTADANQAPAPGVLWVVGLHGGNHGGVAGNPDSKHHAVKNQLLCTLRCGVEHVTEKEKEKPSGVNGAAADAVGQHAERADEAEHNDLCIEHQSTREFPLGINGDSQDLSKHVRLAETEEDRTSDGEKRRIKQRVYVEPVESRLTPNLEVEGFNMKPLAIRLSGNSFS
jgi:hypothetical protein